MSRKKRYTTEVPGYVYIIHWGKKEENNWYIGATQNIERRMREHTYYGYLVPGMNGNLCGVLKFATSEEAFRMEYFLHSIKGIYSYSFLKNLVTILGGHWDEEEIT